MASPPLASLKKALFCVWGFVWVEKVVVYPVLVMSLTTVATTCANFSQFFSSFFFFFFFQLFLQNIIVLSCRLKPIRTPAQQLRVAEKKFMSLSLKLFFF